MKRLATLIIALVFVVIADGLLAKSVSVKGYYRKNGTYVRPHTRNIKSSGSVKTKSSNSKSYIEHDSKISKTNEMKKAASEISPEEETYRRLNSIDEALKVYNSKHRKWPKSLIALYKEPDISIKLCDGWGRNFQYVNSEYGFIVSSAGEDGKHGTADDIKSALSD